MLGAGKTIHSCALFPLTCEQKDTKTKWQQPLVLFNGRVNSYIENSWRWADVTCAWPWSVPKKKKDHLCAPQTVQTEADII